MPAFTILTPTYNHERFIGECIRSVLAQTLPGWEMIILDDGSTDGTGGIAETFAAGDPRIRYLRQENTGIMHLADTYNKGLRMARGKYIAILEGDDLWEPDKLDRQSGILEKNRGLAVAWGRARAVVAATGHVQTIAPREDQKETRFWINRPAGAILNELYLENMIPAVTIAFRKSALEAAGGFRQPDGFPTADLPTLLEMAGQGDFFFDDRILASWRVYSGQTTKMYPVRMLEKRRDYVLGHYAGLGTPVRETVTLTRGTIIRHFHERLLVAYAISGRYRLMRGEFSEARKDYLHAIFYTRAFKPVWRLRAITGFIFSLFKRNVEGLTGKLGRTRYQ